MKDFSIENNGTEVQFNIYVPNIQPGVEIDYSDGASIGPEGPQKKTRSCLIRRQKKKQSLHQKPPHLLLQVQKRIFRPSDTDGNGTVTIQEAEDAGYQMPITSNHWLYPYMIDQNNDGISGE